MQKILFISDYSFKVPGGAQKSMEIIMNGLSDQYEFYVLMPGKKYEYDEKYKIYLVDISLKYNKKIKKHLHMNSKRYSLYIDSLDMIITNEDKINLIFRGWDKEKTFLFKGYRKLYL